MYLRLVYLVQFLPFTSLGSSLGGGGVHMLQNLFHTRNMVLLTLPWPMVD